ERGVRPRLLDRRELLAGDILHERQKQRIAIVGLADDRRHRLHPSVARGAPPALACDQLVAAALTRTHDDGLQQSLPSNRLGEPRGCLWLETSPRLPRVRCDFVHADLRELLPLVDSSYEQLEPAPEPAPLCSAHAAAAMSRRRSTSSCAARQYASAPAELRSYAITGSPCDGASARRTERGIVVLKTRSPKCFRTSTATSAESLVRPSTIVSITPPMR